MHRTDPEFSPTVESDAPVDRAATTQKAGTTIDSGRGRTFPCDECGADLLFHIGQQSLACPYCGAAKSIELDPDAEIVEQDLHAMLERLTDMREQHQRRVPDRKEVKCNGCGGSTVFVGALTTSNCPYCDAPIQLEGVHDAVDRIPVDGILPFLVDHDIARSNLDAWVHSRWFAPNDFKQQGAAGRFNGVYLPYWTFDSLTFTHYSGERGDNYTVTVGTGKDQRTETRTRWSYASGSFQRFFDDVLVVASPGLNPRLVVALDPWPLDRVIPFTQQVLPGSMARTYEVELEEGFDEARRRIDEALHQDICQRIGGDHQRVHSVDTRHDGLTFKHLLLPVWILAYRHRERTYQVLVNGGTGEVQGERPWSWVKIAFTILTVLLLVGGIVALANR